MSSATSYVLLFIYTAALIAGTLADWQEEATAILNDESNKDFLNSIHKLKENFHAYNFDVDRAIPWKGLKESMETLNQLREKYNGDAKSVMMEVQQTAENLINEYRTATAKMFRWAMTGRENIYFLNRRKNEVKNMARIKQFTQNLLDNGKLNIQQNVDALHDICKSLISLEFKLKRLSASLRNELENRSPCTDPSRVFYYFGDFVQMENFDIVCSTSSDVYAKLFSAVDGGLEQAGTIRSCLVEKVTTTRNAMETEVLYVDELNGKVIELSGRSKIIPVDIYELIFEDLDEFALNLNEYVTRHGGGAIETITVRPQLVRQMNGMDASYTLAVHHATVEPTVTVKPRWTLEMEFLEMTNNANAYVDRFELELN